MATPSTRAVAVTWAVTSGMAVEVERAATGPSPLRKPTFAQRPCNSLRSRGYELQNPVAQPGSLATGLCNRVGRHTVDTGLKRGADDLARGVPDA